MRDPKTPSPLIGVPPLEEGSAPVLSTASGPLASNGEEVVRPRDVREVFDAHFDFVWRSLRRLGVREADVDDVLQEVFLVVHRKLPEFGGRSRLTTWLFGICFRVAREHSRRAYVRREEASDVLPEITTEPEASPEELYAGRQARERLDELLAHLDPDKRAVFVLYELEQLPVEEIAESVGVPVGTVYSRLKSARQDFDQALLRLRAKWAHEARRRA